MRVKQTRIHKDVEHKLPTQKQKELLLFVAVFNKENGFSPTNEEIAQGTSISSGNAANGMASALSLKGFILPRARHENRAIVLTKRGNTYIKDYG